MTSWFCDQRCQVAKGGSGPWDDQYERFSSVKEIHQNCFGFQQGERKLQGKQNWGHTDIEKEFTVAFNKEITSIIQSILSSKRNLEKECRSQNMEVV